MKLLKKLFEFAIGNGVVLILGFISSPIITRIIDTDNMGKFSMFNTVVNLLMVVTLLGIDQSFVRYYYEEEEQCRGKLLRQCTKISIIVNVLASVVLLILYKPVSNYIIAKESFIVVMLMVIFLNFSTLSRFALLEIRMKQRAKLYSTLTIIMKVIYLLSIGVMYFIFRNNYMTLIVSTIMGTVFMTLIAIFIERDIWFKSFKDIQVKTSKNELIKYGMPFIFSMAIIWVFQSIDRVTIKGFCGFSEVGLYSGAMTIVGLLNTVQGTFNTFWTPVANEKYAENPDDKEFFVRVNKIVSVVMILGAIGLILFKDVIILILGERYREAVFIFPFLVFMPIMNCISETTVVGINFKKKTKSHIYIAVVSALFNLVGNLILVPVYGAKGAAISTGLSYILFFIARTFIANKYYKVDYSLGRFFVCVAVTYGLAAYSSFYKFNLVILLMGLISIITVIICYKDVFLTMIAKGKEMLLKRKNNN